MKRKITDDKDFFARFLKIKCIPVYFVHFQIIKFRYSLIKLSIYQLRSIYFHSFYGVQ